MEENERAFRPKLIRQIPSGTGITKESLKNSVCHSSIDERLQLNHAASHSLQNSLHAIIHLKSFEQTLGVSP